MSEVTVIETHREHYGDIVVATEPVRVQQGSYAAPMDVTRWVSSPEYGPHRVMGVGFRVKNDGTVGRQPAKPILNFGACPPAVQAAFQQHGYGPDREGGSR